MTKLLTLRNIITLFVMLFLIACTKVSYDDSNNHEVKTYSSEDKSDMPTTLGEIKNLETGEVIFIIKQK
jgi:hypothetical protein